MAESQEKSKFQKGWPQEVQIKLALYVFSLTKINAYAYVLTLISETDIQCLKTCAVQSNVSSEQLLH